MIQGQSWVLSRHAGLLRHLPESDCDGILSGMFQDLIRHCHSSDANVFSAATTVLRAAVIEGISPHVL